MANMVPEKMVSFHELLSMAIQSYQAGDLARAEQLYRSLLVSLPSEVNFYGSLGMIMCLANKIQDGNGLFLRAVILVPENADLHYNLGLTFQQNGHLVEAINSYRKTIVINTENKSALSNCGLAYAQLHETEKAEDSFLKANRLAPGDFGNLMNLGELRVMQDNRQAATELYLKAILIEPGNATIYQVLSQVFNFLGHRIGAKYSAHRAIMINPNIAGAHFSLAMILLGEGNFEEGWREHEWIRICILNNEVRRDFPVPVNRAFNVPQWNGDDGFGRTILIHAEMGYGDSFQFCRYVPLIAAKKWKVLLEAPENILNLFKQLPNVERVIPYGAELPHFDVHCPVMSLPLAFNTRLETIPVNIPYLHADRNDSDMWNERLSNSRTQNRARVGIAWIGTVKPAMEFLKCRSIPDHFLLPLFECKSINLINLQKDIPRLPENLPITDFMPEIQDFSSTAALISNLDLVISVDTAIAHLAGAMGKKVWLLLGFTACWRWMTNIDYSPWYPSMRIFRQPVTGDWGSVIDDVKKSLETTFPQ